MLLGVRGLAKLSGQFEFRLVSELYSTQSMCGQSHGMSNRGDARRPNYRSWTYSCERVCTMMTDSSCISHDALEPRWRRFVHVAKHGPFIPTMSSARSWLYAGLRLNLFMVTQSGCYTFTE